MEEIKGTVATAISYAKTMDDNAREQVRRMCSHELAAGSRVRIMPDVHAGKGCTIGTTMTVTDKAVPNVVGVDIGCGMYTVALGRQEIDFEKLDRAAHTIPSGMNVWDKKQGVFQLGGLCCYSSLKRTDWIKRSLGSLGGGNHFIEVDRNSDGDQFLVIHTGSRNLGKQVANIYQQIAIQQRDHKGMTRNKRIEAAIATCKAEGRPEDIQKEIDRIKREKSNSDLPDDLCYVYGRCFKQYLHDVAICQEFARQNREYIAGILLELAGLKAGKAFHTIHNYIDVDEMILRKGAIAARKDEMVLIPLNMKDGSILAVGKGNPEWNYSAPHGAGRIMSRMQAKRMLDLAEYKRDMDGIYSTSVNEGTLDEAPLAYKPAGDILDVIGDTVDVIDVMKPVYNFKAPEEFPFLKKR